MSGAVVIGRLRVRVRGAREDLTGFPKPVRSGADPLLLRLRAAHLLETADLTPPGLPPGAILTIRRLADPLPGRLTLDAPQLAPDRAWQAALTGRLASLAARAERPLLHAVGAGAEAVLFADPAEMLACLALDWLAGQLLNRWWWREVVRNRQLDAAVIGAWLEAVEAAPAALGHLNRRGAAVAFLRKLDADATTQLLTAVLERHRLTGLHEAAAASVRESALGGVRGRARGEWQPETGPFEQPDGAAREGRAFRESGHDGFAAAAPWSGVVPADSASLSQARQMLLGVGLGLVYASAAVRGEGYARQALRWAVGATEAGELPVRPPGQGRDGMIGGASEKLTPHEPKEEGAHEPARADEGRREGASRGELQSEAAGPGVDARDERKMDASDETGREAVAEQRLQDETPGVQMDMSPLEAQEAAQARSGAEGPAQLAPDLPVENEELALEAVEVRTGYAGLFYLVNVALGMEFYADFTQPDAENELALSPWAFLALVGRALIGDELEADPVWPLLGRLAGAPLTGTEGGEGSWVDRLSGEFTPSDGLDLAQWIERTAGETFAWIAARFPDSPADRAELAHIAFARAGRVRASAGRLDVTLRLDDLHIAVRLAGLDRNPGWVPAAGRTINFYYE